MAWIWGTNVLQVAAYIGLCRITCCVLYISDLSRHILDDFKTYLFSFVETPRTFIIAIINLRDVSTKLNKYIAFTMQTYKELMILNLLFFITHL